MAKLGADISSDLPDRILQTKLYIPRLSRGFISRPRLTARLTAGLEDRISVVAAPPGSGKTTLLSEWARQAGGATTTCFAWLSLDEGDNDPFRFWSYFIAALQGADARLGAAAQGLIRSPQAPALESILAALINEIAAPGAGRNSGRLAVVLDDYHLITAESIHRSLAFFVDHLPPRLHLAVSTRGEPPLPLARWRARGSLTELRPGDLRFTAEEAALFLQQTMGLGLSREEAQALADRTEGWVAGLQLAALSLQAGADPAGFIAGFKGNHRFVMDFLTEEVLRHQPMDRQIFLLQTALLDRLSGPLCDAVTGRTDSQAVLEELAAANLFLLPLDEERHWYRFHRLFAEMLRERLQRGGNALGGTEIGAPPVLHRRAAAWLEGNGFPAPAIQHVLAAGDLRWACRLIEGIAEETLLRSEYTTVEGWLAALPAELRREYPLLCEAQAIILLNKAQFEAIEPWLQSAEAALGIGPEAGKAADLPPREAEFLGRIDAIRATAALNLGDGRRAFDLSRRALQRLPENDPLRGMIELNLGDTYAAIGAHDEAERAFASAVTACQSHGNKSLAGVALASLGALYTEMGRLRQAVASCHEALALASLPDGRQLPTAGKAHIFLARALRLQNELAEAARHADRGIALCREWGHAAHLIDGYVTAAEIALAAGKLPETAAALQSAWQALQGARGLRRASGLLDQDIQLNWREAAVANTQARLWLAAGDTAKAAAWAHKRGIDPAHAPTGLRQDYFTLVRILLAEGETAAAANLADKLSVLARQSGRGGAALQAAVLGAAARDAGGDRAAASARLAEILPLAAAEGYVQPFLEFHPLMERLLHQLASQSEARPHAQKILAAIAPGTDNSNRPMKSPPSATLPEPLSLRELEILRLVADGSSNAEIAATLFLAVGTVKKHLNNIYGKLGVKSRTQALLRAKETGLI